MAGFAQRKNWNRFFSLQPEIEKCKLPCLGFSIGPATEHFFAQTFRTLLNTLTWTNMRR